MKKKHWNDYLWIFSSIYLLLGFFNIMFAWLGLICFITPLLISFIKGNKAYCNNYCGRGQLLQLLGDKYKLTRNKACPSWLKSKWWRYGFLIFFLSMFINMLFTTYLVFNGVNSLKTFVKVFWTINIPWAFANYNFPVAWMNQFAYGFYSVMLTSTLLGFITMFLYKPRTWCVYCPMGTMTQMICKIKNKN